MSAEQPHYNRVYVKAWIIPLQHSRPLPLGLFLVGDHLRDAGGDRLDHLYPLAAPARFI